MKLVILSVIFAMAVLVATPAFAMDVTSIHCSGLQVVYLGDLDGNVLAKCGTPTYKGLARWTYDDGYSDTYVVIHFSAGGEFRRRVMRIEIKNRRAP